MCGRFTQMMSWAEVGRLSGLTIEAPHQPIPVRYNLAPTQGAAMLTAGQATMAQWGVTRYFTPGKMNKRTLLINAALETAHENSWRESLAHRRCLIPANGFYEWRADDSQAFYFTTADRQPMLLAALWEPSEDGPAFVVMTVGPQVSPLGQIHSRVPCVVPPQAAQTWLSPEIRNPQRATAYLEPYGCGVRAIDFWAVGPRVGSVDHDDAGLLTRVEPELRLFG